MNKKMLLPAFVGIALLACAIAVNANMNVLKQKITLEQGNRLVAESKLDAAIKNTQSLDQQLKEAKRKLENIQNIVSEGQSTASQLKSTVEVTSKENEALKAAVKKLQDQLAASQQVAAQQAAAAAAVVTPPVAAQ